jgi:hypothetical protein
MDQWVSLVYVAPDGTLCSQAFEGRLLAQGQAGDVYRRAEDGKLIYFDKLTQEIHEADTLAALRPYLEDGDIERLEQALAAAIGR